MSQQLRWCFQGSDYDDWAINKVPGFSQIHWILVPVGATWSQSHFLWPIVDCCHLSTFVLFKLGLLRYLVAHFLIPCPVKGAHLYAPLKRGFLYYFMTALLCPFLAFFSSLCMVIGRCLFFCFAAVLLPTSLPAEHPRTSKSRRRRFPSLE